MKNPLFTIAALSLSLLVLPSWAMNDDEKTDKPELPADWRGCSSSSWRDFHRDPAEDDNDSSSSSSSDSQSDNGQVEDTKSKTFYLHIANPSAAKFYQEVAETHKLSIGEWKRANAQSGCPSDIEKFFKGTRGTQKLCTTIRKALKKFGATQSLSFAFGQERNGLIVELTTHEEQSAKELAAYCQRSEYIYRVFTGRKALEKHIQAHSLDRAVAIVGLHFGNRMRELAALFQEAQLSNSSPKNGDVSDGSEDGGESDGSN